jgi:uncharacterized protein YbjT (DUF2867 family)
LRQGLVHHWVLEAHIVKLSVMGADAERGITIGRLHRLEEKMIEDSGIPVG